MAIFHLKHSFLRRGRGASSVAKAAYNAGQKLEDNKGSTAYSDYTRKGGIFCDEITLPKGSPAWANNRGELWRRLEAREDKSTRRKDAILAHSFDIALPHELTLEQNIFLARDFVREQFIRMGYAADWAIHAPDPRGDSRNIHLHILVPLRHIEGESFGNKARYSRNQLRQQVITWRKAWAKLSNRHLKRYAHAVTIDERSLLAQGIKRPPTRHKGPRAKSTRALLNGLRAKQPARPLSPIICTQRQVGSDGSVRIQKTLSRTALNSIGLGLANRKCPVDGAKTGSGLVAGALPQANGIGSKTNLASQPNGSLPITKLLPGTSHIASTSKGWPVEAITDWKDWGFRETHRFFAKWPELGSGNAAPHGGLHR